MTRLSADRWRRLEPLVDRLLDTPASQRGGVLDTVAGDDDALRADLLQLLARGEQDHRLLDRSAPERFSALLEDDTPVVPPASLVERYRISRVLGRGGMATVYLGCDVRHDRDVAVKVLLPVLAGPAGRARFLREIQITARLRHPNIVPVFDSGEADALLYYVMPYEEGHSLRERLAREGALPLDDAILILRDLCEALGHAHGHAIAHLDIKPDNILLAGRRAMIADFGVSRALSAATEGEGRGVAAGIGTPTYMAPEQVAASRRVDHRADIYALGVVAWELLAGRPPFTAPSPHALLEAHLTQAPPPLALHRPDVPPILADLVARCLAKDPDERWQSADALLARLDDVQRSSAAHAPQSARAARHSRRRWLAGVAAAVVVGVGIAWGAWLERRALYAAPRAVVGSRVGDLANRAAGSVDGERRTFIVADVENRTGDLRLGRLVTELVRRELAAAPQLAHLSRSDVVNTLRLMRRDSSTVLDAAVVRDVAERLDVPMIVEGSISPAGTGVVLSAQITETRSGSVTHGARAFARDSTELVTAVDRLVRELGQGLGEPLDPPRTRYPRSVTTSSTAAMEQLRSGVAARRIGNYLAAVAHHGEATRIDPSFASAYVALTANRLLAGLPVTPVIPGLARVHQRRDSLYATEAALVDGFHALHVLGDEPAATAKLHQYVSDLLELGGREQGFTSEVATMLARAGDLRAAERVIRQTDSAFGMRATQNQLALIPILHAQGRTREARDVLARLSEAMPDHSTGLRLRAAFLADEGRYGEAHDAAARIPRHHTLLNDLRVQAEMDAVRGANGEGARHLQGLAVQALALGEPGAAIELAAASATLRLALGDGNARADLVTFAARAGVDSLAPPLRPYLPLALFWARAGDARRARTWLGRYERDFPAALRGPERGLWHRARGALAAADGDHRQALAELRAASRLPRLRTLLIDDPDLPLDSHPELARAWAATANTDSAIAVYERYFAVRSLGRTAIDAFERGDAHERLAELYERRGDRERAAAQRELLAELWGDADSPLRRRAARVR